MRESFTYGSVGRAPGNRCLYPEPDNGTAAAVIFTRLLGKMEKLRNTAFERKSLKEVMNYD